MAEKETKPSSGDIKLEEEIQEETAAAAAAPAPEQPLLQKDSSGGGGDGGGWGGWGFSPFSYLSDLQKAAAVAAEEISRNAVEVAKSAAKSISETQTAEDSESAKDNDIDTSAVEDENEDESEKKRKAALDKLEKVSEDSFLGQGLRVLDNKVENFASGAWKALGNAWKGSSILVHQLENSAVNFADSIQNGGLPGPTGSVAPSLLESGKALTAKGMQVLELVGKETMDLLIAETGIEVEKSSKAEAEIEDQLFEEVTFDRCFYIYGGPEQLEELEALSNHYALLFKRSKAKLPSEEKAVYDGKLKQVQQIFELSSEFDTSNVEFEKGKNIDAGTESSADEIKILHDSSVSKAAELAAGFANALAGLASNDIVQRTAGRLDALHSEGVHRLSEMCCFAVTQLLMLGKTIISHANKVEDADIDEDMLKIDWPEDSIDKANILRSKAQSMTRKVQAVSDSFITGISDVAEVYLAAIKGASSETDADVLPKNSIQEKANSFSENLRTDLNTALGKVQDALQYLSYLVLSTSMPTA